VADPLDALRSPLVPMAPDAAFVARLRSRLERAVRYQPYEQPTEESEMSEILLRDRLARNGTRHGDVSYVTLAVPDAAAGRSFYGTVLNWTFGAGRVDPQPTQVDRVIPQVGLWAGASWRPGVTSGALLSWRVDDLAAAVEALRTEGGTASEPEQLPYGLQSDCTDGNGLHFWLHQLPSPGEPAGPNGEGPGDISYVVLRVADLSRAQRLFSAVLNWEFTPGDAGLHVAGPVPMTGMSEGPPEAVLCYRVDDISGAADRVAAAGGRPGAIQARPYGLESLCADNQGIEFYLHQLV
jgi:predicted enzyme related to lactoylglutathione lyase